MDQNSYCSVTKTFFHPGTETALSSGCVTLPCYLFVCFQIKGSARFTLTPNDICGNICHKVSVKLDPGEISKFVKFYGVKLYWVKTEPLLTKHILVEINVGPF